MPEASARKRMIFTIRLLVIIITAYLILFSPSGPLSFSWKAVFIAFYLATDLVVAALPDRFFLTYMLFYPLVLIDTIMVIAGIWISGQAGSDFYLIYFLIISFATMTTRFNYLILNVFVFSAVYAWILFHEKLLAGNLAVAHCLRIPFIMIIALFYGFIVKSVRSDKEEQLRMAYDKLKETRDQLIQKDKMASLGRLASGVAHEIRNPMEIISMGVDYLEGLIPQDRADAKEAVDRIFTAIERVNAIIEDILKFSHKTEFKIECVNITDLIENVLSMAGHSIKKAKVVVNKDFPDPNLCVAGCPNMLSQVFLNLINNAIDAMETCPVKRIDIWISKQKAKDIGYKTGYRRADYFSIGDDMIVVGISDTGKGMPEDVMMKIFEPFFTTKPQGSGTGLGLSLAHMIIDRMRGTIDVESRVGEGTTFFVKLQPWKEKAADFGRK